MIELLAIVSSVLGGIVASHYADRMEAIRQMYVVKHPSISKQAKRHEIVLVAIEIIHIVIILFAIINLVKG